MIDTSDLPPNYIRTFEGDRFILLPNTDTRLGLAKGRRCRALRIKNRTGVSQFDDDEARTLTRIRLMLVEAAHITPPGIRHAWCLASADQSVQK
jgi:hypothetical protein